MNVAKYLRKSQLEQYQAALTHLEKAVAKDMRKNQGPKGVVGFTVEVSRVDPDSTVTFKVALLQEDEAIGLMEPVVEVVFEEFDMTPIPVQNEEEFKELYAHIKACWSGRNSALDNSWATTPKVLRKQLCTYFAMYRGLNFDWSLLEHPEMWGVQVSTF